MTTLQRQSFGKVTVRLTGPDAAIENFRTTLSRTTDIQEVTR